MVRRLLKAFFLRIVMVSYRYLNVLLNFIMFPLEWNRTILSQKKGASDHMAPFDTIESSPLMLLII